jgi:plastocyanin
MTIARATPRIVFLLIALVAGGGITATLAHGDDPAATATFKTVDVQDVFQLTAGSGTSTSAHIVTGGTVTFANSSTEMHDVDFNPPAGGGVSCQQTSGGTSPSSLRFPSSPAKGAWGGVCTFTKPGTYSFVCDMHVDQGMTGTVVVTDAGAPPGTTTAPTTTATKPVTTVPSGGTSTTPTTAAPITTIGTSPVTTATTPTKPTTPSTPSANTAEAPVTVAKALSVRVGLAQRGSSVRGTINGAKGSARVKIALTARRGDIGLAGNAAALVGVGSLAARTTSAGVLTFAAKLDGKARTALATRRHLTLTVRITAPTVMGASTLRTFRIVLRPAS